MTEENNISDPGDFDQIIKQVGDTGLFQNRLNYVFNSFFLYLLAMPYMNLIMSLAVPDHWCHVPGQEYTNYTLEEWKQLTIPRELNAFGNPVYSKCTRFANISDIDIIMRNNDRIIKCTHGWKFDHTWYDQTAPMQNEWVCDNSMIPTNTLALDRAGEVIGALIFSYLADNFGRLPVFFTTVGTLIIGRITTALTSADVTKFMVFSFIGSLSIASAFFGPAIIAVEVSHPADRAYIRMIGSFAWSCGVATLPLLMWWLRDWMYFMLITSVPCAIYIFFLPWLVESPRWLASRGETKRCIVQLQKIAKANKTKIPNNIEDQLTRFYKPQQGAKIHTFIGLFSSWRLAKNTIILVYINSAFHIIYVCLVINISNLNANPFLQYMYQALAALPAYLLAKIISDYLGRRWVILAGGLICFVGNFITIYIVQDSSNIWLEKIMCIIIKFGIGMIFFCITLQSIEMYPTCLRQTGLSVGSVVANFFSILSPYIIALGIKINPTIPYIIHTILSFIALIVCLLVPETLGHKLPESLKDASVFGANQDIWGRTKQKEDDVNDVIVTK